MPDGYLSPHFSLAELTYSDAANARGIDNTPDVDAVDELTDLANVTLERIRTICGDQPVIISSGYRCRELNEAVGGASVSAHLVTAVPRTSPFPALATCSTSATRSNLTCATSA